MNSHAILDQLAEPADAKEKLELTTLHEEVKQLNKLWIEYPNTYEQKDKDFVKRIEKLSAAKAFKLAQRSDEFRAYVDRPHSELWQQTLKKKGYHGGTLTSLDASEKCTPYKQYVGSYLFGLWKNNPDKSVLLDKACEMNIFPALSARCTMNLNLLVEKLKPPSSTSADEINKLEDKIMRDIAHICNQYWAPGYIYSYSSFIKLSQLHRVEVHSEEDAIEAKKEDGFLKLALECKFMADKLIKHEVSEQIFNEHNFLKQLAGPIANLTQAESLVLDSLPDDRKQTVYNEAVEEVKEISSHFRL